MRRNYTPKYYNHNLPKVCMYCKCDLGQSECSIILKAIYPPYHPKRWFHIGFGCDDCEAAGKKMNFEYFEQLPRF